MTNNPLTLDLHNTIPAGYAGILFKRISDYAFQEKGLPPIQPCSIFIKDQKYTVLGELSGIIFYGSLYIDSLSIDKTIRH